MDSRCSHNCHFEFYYGQPNRFAKLGLRWIYMLIAWCFLCTTCGSKDHFFSSIMLYSIPVSIDYIGVYPKFKPRKLANRVGITLSGSLVVIAVLGLTNILEVIKQSSPSKYLIATSPDFAFCSLRTDLRVVLFIALLSVINAIIDWVVYMPKFEERLLKGIMQQAASQEIVNDKQQMATKSESEEG